MLKVAAGISGAALSPLCARLPRGLPRGFRPQASEPTPRVGSRGPALAIRRGDAARLESDRLRRFFPAHYASNSPSRTFSLPFSYVPPRRQSQASRATPNMVTILDVWAPRGSTLDGGRPRRETIALGGGKRRNERHRAGVSGSPTLMKPSQASRASCVARTGGSGPPADRPRWLDPTADPFAPGGDPGSPCPRPWPRAPTGRRRTPP